MHMHIVVVMPDHMHMIFTPLEDEKQETFSFEEIVGAIKGASSHSVNKVLERSGTVCRMSRSTMSYGMRTVWNKKLNMSARIR